MPKRSLLTGFMIAVALLLVTLLAAALFFRQAGRETAALTPAEEEPATYGVLYQWELLENLRDDRSDIAEEKLAMLAGEQSAAAFQASILLAARLRESGRDAAPYFRQALSLFDSADVRWQLAAYLLEQGLILEAQSEFIRLLPDEAAIRELISAGTAREIIGEALAAGRHWQQAVTLLESELKDAADTIDAVQAKIFCRALVELGQYGKALSFFEKWKTWDQADPELLWLYARSLEGAGREDKAVQIYTKLGVAGAYRLGLLLERAGKKVPAAEAFGQSAEPASRWRGARLWDELGSHKKAIPLYISLAREQGRYQDDAAYRLFQLLDSGDSRSEEMLRVLDRYPAWAHRLGREYSLQLVPDQDYPAPAFLLRADALREAGWLYYADLELAIGGKFALPEDKIALGNWHLDRGQYDLAVRWGAGALSELPSRRAYELAYPRPFSDWVLREAEAFGLDANLIWAVMREESRFRPGTVSRAGALGLMQVMPATGREIARALKTSVTDEELLLPEVNIRFGVYYLRRMLDMFGGDIDKALAAYNGGSGNVRRWLDGRTAREAGGFPTAVAFFETREYITKVQNSYQTYLLLYGD